MAIHHPALFKKWKKKYGLPSGYFKKEQKEQKKIEEFDVSTATKAIKAHRTIHSNYSQADWKYYKTIHNRVVKAMMNHGLRHTAYEDQPLDHMMNSGAKLASKWLKGKSKGKKKVISY